MSGHSRDEKIIETIPSKIRLGLEEPADPSLGYGMCRFGIASFMASKHDYELTADNFWHLHLDHKHIGSGGDDSWSPSVLEVARKLSLSNPNLTPIQQGI